MASSSPHSADAASRSPELWQPFLDALRGSAPPGTRETVFEGTFTPGSWGGITLDDGSNEARFAAESSEHRRRLREAAEPLRRAAGSHGMAVRARVTATGEQEVLLVPGEPGVDFGQGPAVFDCLTLVPDALPLPYRLAPEPAHDRGISPRVDPAEVARITRAALPHAVPASKETLDGVEGSLGIALPPDVRALYETASSGTLELPPHGEDDGELWGMRLIAPDDTAARSYARPEHRFGGWKFGALEVVLQDPEGRVQPLATSPAWFPIADDGGGSLIAIDLAPGPRGHMGQVVYLDHEESAGAQWLADSVTELLVERPAPRFRRPSPPPDLLVRVSARTGGTLEAVTPQTEVLVLGKVDERVDLSGLAGHSRLRCLVVSPGSATGLEAALDSLPALEYLELDADGWARLLASGTVPRTLLAAGFSTVPGRGGSPGPEAWTGTLRVANALRELWSLPPIHMLRLSEPTTPPEHPDTTEPRSTENPAEDHPYAEDRPWWRRLFGGGA